MWQRKKRGMLTQAFSFSFMQPRLRFVSSYLTQLLNYYKHITYGSGAGKTFLDETAFVTEDALSDLKFGQACTNWLMLIESVLDPVIEQGWCMHHKRMVSDRGFSYWVQAWHAHDQLLHS